jgi:4-amino-4-deoxy-L-arabinose transferase-like glycosyltransferase
MVREADSRPFGLWPYALILVLGVVVLLPGLGDFGFWDPREGVYAQGAREMLERGSVFVPSYRGEPLPAPPLPFWSIAVGSLVFGLGEFGARIGGACVALATLLLVYYAVSLLRGRSPALLAAVVLGTTPQFYLLARQAGPDVFVVAGVGLGLLFFCVGLFAPDRRRNLHFALSGGFLGIGALAKGLVWAGGIFLSVWVVYSILRFDGRRLRRWAGNADERRRVVGHVLLFGTVFLIVVVPWLAAMALDAGGASAGTTVLLGGEEQQKPFHFYFRPLIFGCFPWILFLPLAVTRLIHWRDRDPFERYGSEIFLLVASAVTFVIISIPAGKWPSYAAPLLVPLAVLIGLALDRLLRTTDGAVRRFSWILAFLLFLPAASDLLRADGIEYLLESVTTNGEVPATLLPSVPLTVLLLAIGGTMVLSIVVRSRILVGALALATACLAVYYGSVFVPSLDPFKSMRGVCDVWGEYRSTDERVGFLGQQEGATYYYCESRVDVVHPSTFLDFMNPETPAFCIIERDAARELGRLYLAQYPESSLSVVDDQHQTYALISNHIPGGS